MQMYIALQPVVALIAGIHTDLGHAQIAELHRRALSDHHRNTRARENIVGSDQMSCR